MAALSSREKDMSSEYSQPTDEGNPDRALRIDIVTLFPDMFAGPFAFSMVARARQAGLVEVCVHDLRDWSTDRHRTTDDYAYGGGGGMVMLAEPIFRAVEELLGLPPITAASPWQPECPVVLMTPQGCAFNHGVAAELAGYDRLVLVCGHYEGYDERVRLHLATHEISVGDFVVTGGELPAMLVTDAVIRLRPGVLGLDTAAATDSFASRRLEHPHYTRPADFRGWAVPPVLLSGHHAEVARWRRREALRRTWERRPDLLTGLELTDEERRWLTEWGATQPQ
jgi:tRNA (guanine37-N1)-methyltransferase